MADWIRCTRPDGRPVHLNLENAISISAMGTGLTIVAFAGGAEDTVRVTETPEQILASGKAPADIRRATPMSRDH